MSRPGDPIGPVEARWRGERGAKGDKGERGDSVLPRKVRRSLVVLFLLPSLIALIAVTGLVVQSDRQAEIRCTSLAQIVAIPVPIPVTGNPSRQWVYRYVQIQRQRGVRLGCHLPPPKFVQSPPKG